MFGKKEECCSMKEPGTSIEVEINVTKIVKCVCITGVLIVAIIFGTRCLLKALEMQQKNH